MATQRTCDHCSLQKPGIGRMAVSVDIEGAARPTENTGTSFEADICPDCRAAAGPKLAIAAQSRVLLIGPLHAQVRDKREAADAKRAEIKGILTAATAAGRGPNTTESADIVTLESEAAALEAEAETIVVQATAAGDAVTPW
jgi:hypothetical protein